jgi:hypothetical protein
VQVGIIPERGMFACFWIDQRPGLSRIAASESDDQERTAYSPTKSSHYY